MSDDALRSIGLRRLRLWPVPSDPEPAPAVARAAAVAELSTVGARPDAPERLTAAALATLPALLRALAEGRGQRGSAPYVPLFTGFPDRLPDHDDVALRFWAARSRLAARPDPAAPVTDEQLRDALDFTRFGWWPPSSVPADPVQTLVDRQLQELRNPDPRIEWLQIRFVAEEGLQEALRDYLVGALTSTTPLRTDVRDDVAVLLRHLSHAGVDLRDVPVRETRVLLLRQVWDADPAAVARTGAGPDDVMRLLADLTGTDVSLARDVRYPALTRAERRAVVDALEASPRLGDLFRRRDLWRSVLRGLHVGEHAARAPRLAEAAARLRASRHDATSLASRAEAVLPVDAGAAARLLAQESPGQLVRGLRRFLAVAEGQDPGAVERVLAALGASSRSVPVPLLLAALGAVADDGRSYPRVAVSTSGRPRLLPHAPGHLALGPAHRTAALDALDAALDAALATRDSWAGERVWVDPALRGVLVPTGLRTTERGSTQLARGSRLALGEAAVLRLFLHWREPEPSDDDGEPQVSDLDLSVLALDAELRPVGHCSFTELAVDGMRHSGDVIGAPDGAEEFVDVDLAKALARADGGSWSYLVITVLRYAGPPFDALAEATCGWMLRDATSSEHLTFDPATVVEAFDVTGPFRYAVPAVVDLTRREVLFTGLSGSTAALATVERDGGAMAALLGGVLARNAVSTSVDDLVRRHARVRGAHLVSDREAATITAGLDDGCTYDARHPEAILADLL